MNFPLRQWPQLFSTMKSTRSLLSRLLPSLLFSSLLVNAFADANPPERMTYQGFVVDANGTALGFAAPKNYDVVFRIWSDQSATEAGKRLWSEQQTVTIDKGYLACCWVKESRSPAKASTRCPLCFQRLTHQIAMLK